MRVSWEDEGVKAVFEDMNAVLIKRLHPNAERIDGSGGDGGRDVIVEGDDGLTVFELKSFTGRLSEGGRKAQVRRSLQEAARHDPNEWHLVAPIDLTPTEDAWFGEMTAQFPFRCNWQGRTWLDLHHAQMPELARYFVDGFEAEVIRTLKEIQATPASTATELLARVQTQVRLLNEGDPFYSYRFVSESATDAIRKGAVAVVHRHGLALCAAPRYRTATEDRPIRLRLDYDEATTSAEVLDALKFGEPVSLEDVVLSYEGPEILRPEESSGPLRIEALPQEFDQETFVQIDVVDTDGATVLGTVEVGLEERRLGIGGGTVSGSDGSGLLRLRLQFDRGGHARVTLGLTPVPVIPAVAVSVLEVLAEIQPGRHIRVRLPGATTGQTVPVDARLVESELLELYRAMSAIQARAGAVFSLPTDLDSTEYEAILEAGDWLSEHGRCSVWSEFEVLLEPHTPDEVRDDLRSGESLVLERDTTFQFRGRDLHLGILRSVFTGKAEQLTTREDGTLVATFRPDGDDQLVERIVDAA